jgi:S1-C subfamily serine protease
MIGLAFSSLGGAQNIGYIIPNEEIELFLKDVADRQYQGKAAMFDQLQTLENPALRTFLALGPDVKGIVVNRPFTRTGPSPLELWDVITRIGDTPIDDQGMVQVGPNMRIRFQYLVQHAARNGKVPLTLLRHGKTVAVELPVSPAYPTLLPDTRGSYPRYFIYGPMVFSAASMEMMHAVGRTFAFPGSPLISRASDPPAFAGEEMVVVPSPFFPDKLVKGYGSPQGQVVKSVNGVAIKNLHHLVEVLRDARQEYITFAFWGMNTETLVFTRAQIERSTEEILNDNGIRAQGSPDLMALWNAKPRP